MRNITALFLFVLAISAVGDERREVRAVRTAAPPVIDGRVDEDVWALAPAITGFQQQRPDNGQPSSEEIRVHLLFDDDALYVGAVMPQKGSPVARLLARRDTYLESEWIGILLDPQLDRRSGYELFVNPDNVQLDGVIANDTVEDYDWDGVWQSATSVYEGGWSAEMRIPFSQFRFPEKEKQVWGINFIRWVRGRQEQARMVAHPRNQPGFVSKFGNLVGLDGIRPRPKVEALPYVTAGLTRDETILRPDPLGQRSRRVTDAGLDLRWSTRSSLMIAATIQPDFGQVEVDPAILNLSEFELFFPEKRPFFVEGSKIFNFGAVARNYTASPYRLAHPLLFYSRRIGREPQGNARLGGDFLDLPSSTSILGAAKVSGRTNSGTSFSVLDAITDSEHATVVANDVRARRMVAPRTNFFAGRVTQDLGSESRLGRLLERRFEIAPRVDWTFTRNLSLQLYPQPLAASGTYSEFKELLAPRGGYRAVPATTVANPDFTFRSFRGNAVLRWEVEPTTLFAIWNEGREARTLATTGGRFGDFRDIAEVEPTDRIMVKASYRFDYPR